MFDVKWSGSWPCLCSGEWTIIKDGVNVSSKIPEELRSSEMHTLRNYEQWRFIEGYNVEWTIYMDGLGMEEWIKANNWISAICDTEDEKEDLYSAINREDWRHSSCGGCI